LLTVRFFTVLLAKVPAGIVCGDDPFITIVPFVAVNVPMFDMEPPICSVPPLTVRLPPVVIERPFMLEVPDVIDGLKVTAPGIITLVVAVGTPPHQFVAVVHAVLVTPSHRPVDCTVTEVVYTVVGLQPGRPVL